MFSYSYLSRWNNMTRIILLRQYCTPPVNGVYLNASGSDIACNEKLDRKHKTKAEKSFNENDTREIYSSEWDSKIINYRERNWTRFRFKPYSPTDTNWSKI